MNRYAYTIALSAAACVLQIWLVAQPQLSRLTPKSSALAQDALSGGLSSISMISVFAAYLLICIATHAVPMLCAAKIHNDLEAGGPQRLRQVLAIRGAFTVSLLGAFMLMVIANHFLFPESQALPNSDLLMIQPASPIFIFGLPLLYATTLLYWLVLSAGRRIQIGFGTLALGALAAWAAPATKETTRTGFDQKPDLIVIGVDSLRPDHLASFGFTGPSQTPAIDRFVNNSVRFEYAYTPQARTFVAYMSLLTAQYPTRHGVRENLYPRTMFRPDKSIAHRLKKRGYTTVFAIDEARFANFDQSFGFDEVVSPPPGTADFVVGGFLDTVGTNLLQLVPGAGAKFLPHVAGNRAAVFTYKPNLHSEKLQDAIDAIDGSKPLYLVSHFCMAHSPYALGAPFHTAPTEPFIDSPNSYRAALTVADSQIARLFSDLQSRGRLDNAIVVLLSDHGEALGMDKDKWELSGASGDATSTDYHGHGSPALDEAQSRVLLSMQRFYKGKAIWTPRLAPNAVSLIDVMPTLLAVTGVPYAASDFDGISILNADGVPNISTSRAIFVESGISGISLQKAKVEPGEVANEFNYLYGVTKDQRFELLPVELPEQLRKKQRGIVLGRYGLSSWPALNEAEERCWLRIALDSREATCVPLDSQDPIVEAYKPLLCRHFSGDSEFFEQWCTVAALRPPRTVSMPQDV